MSYATVADMRARYPEQELIQLSDIDTPATDAVVDAVLEQALADASAMIDGYTAARYGVPLSPVPAKVVADTCELARYQLLGDRVSDSTQKRVDAILKFLQMVATGQISLGATAAGAPIETPADTVQFDPGTKVFGRDRRGGF